MAKQVTIEDALDYCLANPDGLSNEELLARFSQHREELQPLLTLGTSIQNIAPPPVPTERRAAMKSRLMSAAASSQSTEAAPAVLSTRPTPSAATEPVTQPVRARSTATGTPIAPQRGWLVRWLASLQRPLAVTAAAAAMIIALLWWGSARALPDSPLYAVKLAGETIQTGFGRTAAEETRNHIALANSRLRDLRTMQSQGNLTNAGSAFINYRDHLASGGTFWKQTTGNERVELARLLYGSTLAGKETFSDLGNIADSLPASMRTTIQETISALGTINTDTAQALRTAGVDPASVTVPAELVGRVAPVPSASVVSPGSTALSTAQGAATTSPQATSSNSVPATTVVAESPTGTATTIATATTPGTAAATTTVGTVIATPTADNSPVAATPSAHRPSPEPTLTMPPTNTARPAAQTATAQVEPPTRTPERSSPTARPAERTPNLTPSARPTDVRVPPTPSARPTNVPVIPPTPSARPSGVPVPSQTHGRPTHTNPPGTNTPKPAPTSNVCDLDVTSVSISCSSNGCVDWTARVRNRGATALRVSWTAELQVKQKGGGGGFQTVNVQGETASFAADTTTTVANSFCYNFPDGNYDIRVRFSLSAENNLACAPQRNSSIIDECVRPEPTNTPRPTDTPRPRPTEEPTRPRPTHTPQSIPPTSTPRPERPTRTPEPDETRQPKPPRPTEGPQPTEEPRPAVTPRPEVTQRPTRSPR